MSTIRILVADDNTLVRRLLVQRLSQEDGFCCVGEAEDGVEVVEMSGKLHPDIVLMDIEMPHVDGATACARITSQWPTIKVLLLTGHYEIYVPADVVGAVAVLNKNVTPLALISSIRTAATSPSPIAARREAMKASKDCFHQDEMSLTHREKLVLDRLVNTNLTQAQIAADLDGVLDGGMSISAVKHAVERVMSKLEVTPRTRSALVKRVHSTRLTSREL